MGCVVVLLLAGILSTTLFRPTPVLVVLGLGAAYAVLMLIAMRIGEVGAAIGRVGSDRRATTPSAAPTAEPAAAPREPFFGDQGVVLIGIVILVTLGVWVESWFRR
jgi:Na+-transporting methylmalonyl-CoA/oxaloacetate decarboxylase gamma subunit